MVKGIGDKMVQPQDLGGGRRCEERGMSGHGNKWETKQAQSLAVCSCP